MLAAERGASKNTIAAYRRDLIDAQAFTALDSAETDDLHRYIASLTKRGMSATTIARRISALKQYYQFLFSEKIREDNPTTKLHSPKKGRRLPKYLSEEEVDTLLAAAHEDTSPDGLRLTCLLEVLYASGLRASEIISLKQSALIREQTPQGDVYFLRVIGKGNKERIAPLNTHAVDAIAAHLEHVKKQEHHDGWLFPSSGKSGHLTRQRLGQLLKQLAINAGIDQSRISPHVIRHSFASHILNHGINLRELQELLGHSDIATTQIYTHIADDALKSLVETSHPLAKRSSHD